MSVIRRVVVKTLETGGEHLCTMLLCSISKNGIPLYKLWLFLEVTKNLFITFQFYFTIFQIFLCHFIRFFIPTNLTILTWLTLTMAKIGYSPLVAGWFHYLRISRWCSTLNTKVHSFECCHVVATFYWRPPSWQTVQIIETVIIDLEYVVLPSI